MVALDSGDTVLGPNSRTKPGRVNLKSVFSGPDHEDAPETCCHVAATRVADRRGPGETSRESGAAQACVVTAGTRDGWRHAGTQRGLNRATSRYSRAAPVDRCGPTTLVNKPSA